MSMEHFYNFDANSEYSDGFYVDGSKDDAQLVAADRVAEFAGYHGTLCYYWNVDGAVIAACYRRSRRSWQLCRWKML